MRIVTEAFIVVETAEQAVDRLAELHGRATSALSQALKRYLKDRIEPDAAEPQLLRGIEQLSQVMTDVDSRQLLDKASRAVLDRDFYPAMRHLRALLPREERLFAAAGRQ